jgi:hypothetical protein
MRTDSTSFIRGQDCSSTRRDVDLALVFAFRTDKSSSSRTVVSRLLAIVPRTTTPPTSPLVKCFENSERGRLHALEAAWRQMLVVEERDEDARPRAAVDGGANTEPIPHLSRATQSCFRTK